MKFSVSRLPSEAPGLDADLAAAHPEQRIPGIALLEQHLAVRQMLGVAEIGQPLELVRAEIGEHRVHLQDDRKFGLFAHLNVLVNLLVNVTGKSLGTINFRIA
ncbi:hypothetical protein ACVMBY_003937 [Bradyrhizobium huanghuaihaiense]